MPGKNINYGRKKFYNIGARSNDRCQLHRGAIDPSAAFISEEATVCGYFSGANLFSILINKLECLTMDSFTG
jgi:hypothetical protein